MALMGYDEWSLVDGLNIFPTPSSHDQGMMIQNDQVMTCKNFLEWLEATN